MLNKWQTVLDEIKSSVSDMAFNTYFVGTEFVSEEDGIVTFSVKNTFAQSTVDKKYRSQVLAALKEAGYNCTDYKIVVSSNQTAKVVRRPIEVPLNEPTTSKIPERSFTPIPQKPAKNKLNPKYTLDNYVVGSNNDLAVSAAHAIIENPGMRYNPFFLYGGSGYGKTHLIQAIGNELQKLHPEFSSPATASTPPPPTAWHGPLSPRRSHRRT